MWIWLYVSEWVLGCVNLLLWCYPVTCDNKTIRWFCWVLLFLICFLDFELATKQWHRKVFLGKGQIEECIFYWQEHLKSLKSPVPFSLPSCFLSDNNLFQVELPWLAAPYHTFGLGKWSLEVFVKYFLIIHKLAPDWSSLQQNAKFTPACSKSSEPCIRKLTFKDYYDLQTVATSLKWVLCGIWW